MGSDPDYKTPTTRPRLQVKEYAIPDENVESFNVFLTMFFLLKSKRVAYDKRDCLLTLCNSNKMESNIKLDTGNPTTTKNRINWYDNKIYILSGENKIDNISWGTTKAKLAIWDYVNNKFEIKNITITL